MDNEDDEETDGSEIDEQSSDEDQDNTEQLKLALHKAMMSANQHSDDVTILIIYEPVIEINITWCLFYCIFRNLLILMI